MWRSSGERLRRTLFLWKTSTYFKMYGSEIWKTRERYGTAWHFRNKEQTGGHFSNVYPLFFRFTLASHLSQQNQTHFFSLFSTFCTAEERTLYSFFFRAFSPHNRCCRLFRSFSLLNLPRHLLLGVARRWSFCYRCGSGDGTTIVDLQFRRSRHRDPRRVYRVHGKLYGRGGAMPPETPFL